jgi:hypothetical protein
VSGQTLFDVLKQGRGSPEFRNKVALFPPGRPRASGIKLSRKSSARLFLFLLALVGTGLMEFHNSCFTKTKKNYGSFKRINVFESGIRNYHWVQAKSKSQ